MKRIYIASGYNSWTNKHLIQAFATKKEAETFVEGLTDFCINMKVYKSVIGLANILLKG